MSDLSDRELLKELGVDIEQESKPAHTPREERILAGFEDIQYFVKQHNCLPQHGEGLDIFERLYAIRLDRMRELEECRNLLVPHDHQGLLSGGKKIPVQEPKAMDDEALLAELGVKAESPDIADLQHVRSSIDKRAAEEIANRQRCQDFDRFKPLFQQVQQEIDTGIRQTRFFELKAEIRPGSWFILGGQKAYVAEMGETFFTAQGMTDARLRVIFDNGTESNMLMRSLQRALHKDESGRRITDPSAGPLFSDQHSDEDSASGTIYVLRSKSTKPIIVQNRDIIHKIGVTGNDVAQRIANCKLDPTFLMADVEIVATYKLYNINRAKLENIIHRIFDHARLDIEIMDRWGNPIIPREWFLVPLFIIDEAVQKIKDGTISKYIYDVENACLKLHSIDD